MIDNFLKSSKGGIDVSICGAFCAWTITDGDTAAIISNKTRRWLEMPVVGNYEDKIYGLDFKKFSEASASPSLSNSSLSSWTQETVFHYGLMSNATLRSRRYVNNGVELYSSIPGNNWLGVAKCQYDGSVAMLLDLFVDAEVQKAHESARDKAKDKIKSQLSKLYEWSAILQYDQLNAFVPIVEANNIVSVIKPKDCRLLSTPLGCLPFPTSVLGVATDGTHTDILRVYLDELDLAFDSSSLSEVELQTLINDATVADEAAMTRQLELIMASNMATNVKTTDIMVTRADSIVFWYYLAKCAFQKDIGLEKGAIAAGFASFNALMLAIAQNGRFIAI